MSEGSPQGCNGLQEVIEAGYLQVVHYYTEPEGDATSEMVTFPDPEDIGLPLDVPEEARGRVFVFNFCPFCGTRMQKGKPQCGGRRGRRKETKVDVVGE